VPTTTWFAFWCTVMQLQQFLRYGEGEKKRPYSTRPSEQTSRKVSGAPRESNLQFKHVMFHLVTPCMLCAPQPTGSAAGPSTARDPPVPPWLCAVSRGSKGRTRAATRTLVSAGAPVLSCRAEPQSPWQALRGVVPRCSYYYQETLCHHDASTSSTATFVLIWPMCS
jgi:hypothetical protein